MLSLCITDLLSLSTLVCSFEFLYGNAILRFLRIGIIEPPPDVSCGDLREIFYFYDRRPVGAAGSMVLPAAVLGLVRSGPGRNFNFGISMLASILCILGD